MRQSWLSLALIFACQAVYAAQVSVSPASVTLTAGQSQQFTATANAGQTTFTWSVNGISGGDATVGTISSTGLYVAPPVVSAAATVTIAASSSVKGSASGTATVTLQP